MDIIKLKKIRNKKAYLFILDAIVAMMVMTIGISLILSYRATEPPTQQAEIYSNDLVQFYSKIKIKDLNNAYFGLNGELVANGNISTVENTILEQLGEFYFRYSNQSCDFCLNMTNNSINVITKSLLLDQFNYEIIVDDYKIGKRTILYVNKKYPPKSKAQLILPTRRMVHGVYNNTLYGPYIMEITVWQ